MASIIEITEDNMTLLGVVTHGVALVDDGTTTIVTDMSAALDELAARRNGQTAPVIGEGLPVGSGRRWVTVDY